MFSRFYISIVLSLLLAMVFTAPAFGGGWAVITLDELPTGVVSGKPLTIGFMVRQHGITPMSGIYPTVTAQLSSDEQFLVNAEPEGQPGHYTATLTFPKEGHWEWSIQAFTMDQSMPTLTVSAPGSVAMSQPAKAESINSSISPLLMFRVVAFGVALVGLWIAFQRKSRLAVAFTGLCFLIGVGTFITRPTVLEAEAQGKPSSQASVTEIELGRQLFIAKGCITCHYNDRAADRSEYWTIEMGAPDLSAYSANTEVLFIRLKDPSEAKSDTKMPNLELKKTEIEALVAFINSK